MSLREIVNNVDSQKDLSDFLVANRNKVPQRTGEPRYDRHPVSLLVLSLRCYGEVLTWSRYWADQAEAQQCQGLVMLSLRR